jgi:hypothetical protein
MNAVKQLMEFLEISIHNILYARKIYPLSLFEKTQIYRVAVWKSRIPALNTYIENVLNDIQAWLKTKSGTLEKLCVGVLNPGGDVLERFVFEIRMPEPESSNADYGDNTFSPSLISIRERAEAQIRWLEESFRSFITRLRLVDASLGDLPSGCSFKIFVYSKAHRDDVDEARWSPVQSKDAVVTSTNRSIKPIRSAVPPNGTLPGYRLQLFVEKGRHVLSD